ncbi:hypothetical protein [Rhodocaloribacter sp.]
MKPEKHPARRVLFRLVCCLLAVPLFTTASSAQVPRKHLFIDDHIIAHTYQVVRVIPEPARHPYNPLIEADRPWEGKNVYLYGTVLYDEGRFRMWYQVFNPDSDDPLFRTSVGYAESRDGITWTKPALDIISYKGQPTNLVLQNHGTSDLVTPAVVKTPDDPDPAKRYKMLYYDSMSKADLEEIGPNFPLGKSVPGWRALPGEGFFIAYSPDGIHWTHPFRQPVFTCPCDASSMTRGKDGTYHAWFKTSTASDRHFRILGQSDSKDFEHWSEPGVILEPDWHDPFGTEFYGMSAFDYAGSTIGLIWVYHNAPDDKTVDIQLATYREGRWQRAADRKTFFKPGPPASWDAGALFAVASDLVVSPPGHEDEIWIYYGGNSVHHDDRRFRETSIGLATIRLDGFAAMHAGQFDGILETKPLPFEKSSLFLNADARHGAIQVEVLDSASGQVLARSRVISRLDGTRLPVTWESGDAPDMGKEVVLRFRMKKTDLYAFWFE